MSVECPSDRIVGHKSDITTDCPTDRPSDGPILCSTLCPCPSMCPSNVRRMSDVYPMFWVQQLNGAITNTVKCNRKSVFQDGGRKTGSTYISASRQDSNAVPMAKSAFSRSRKSVALFRIQPDVNGSRYFKMAADAPEVLMYRLLEKIATPFERLTPIFGVL